jgi:hypothetical protein
MKYSVKRAKPSEHEQRNTNYESVSSHYTKTQLGELARARETGDLWSRDITSFSIVPPEPESALLGVHQEGWQRTKEAAQDHQVQRSQYSDTEGKGAHQKRSDTEQYRAKGPGGAPLRNGASAKSSGLTEKKGVRVKHILRTSN